MRHCIRCAPHLGLADVTECPERFVAVADVLVVRPAASIAVVGQAHRLGAVSVGR